jgi:hypothetical protein
MHYSRKTILNEIAQWITIFQNGVEWLRAYEVRKKEKLCAL